MACMPLIHHLLRSVNRARNFTSLLNSAAIEALVKNFALMGEIS